MSDTITYGVFDRREEDGTVQSVPLVNGEIMPPHILDVVCSCNPTLEQHIYLFVGHNMVQ